MAASSSASGSNSRSPLFHRHHSAYFLAKPIVKGSAVKHVVYGHIRSPSSKDIVFAKDTSLELVTVEEDGLGQLVCDLPVFGMIIDIRILPREVLKQKDFVVVTSDSRLISILSFDDKVHRFSVVCHAEPSTLAVYRFGGTPLSDIDKFGLRRRSQVDYRRRIGYQRPQFGEILTVDSNGCFIASIASGDHLALLKVSGSTIKKINLCPSLSLLITYKTEDAMKLHSIRGRCCFISKKSREHDPVFAVLLQRVISIQVEVWLLNWNTRTNSVSVLSKYTGQYGLYGSTQQIFEVPYSYGYALILTRFEAQLMDFRDPNRISCVNQTHSQWYPMFCSWCWEPGKSKKKRLICCTETMEFFMLEIQLESVRSEVNIFTIDYSNSVPFTKLSWAENGFVIALAKEGGGMVLKFEDGEEGDIFVTRHIKLSEKSSIKKVPPILDMSLVDYDYHDEKHEHIFACCGMAPDGSIRVIGDLVSLKTISETFTESKRITGTWALKMNLDDPYHSFLVLSSLEHTQVLSVGEFLDITDKIGFLPDVCTLACGVISDGLLVQIHPAAVQLSVACPDGIQLVSPSWSPPGETHISIAAVGNNFIVVATPNPCWLFILGVRNLRDDQYEMYEINNVMWEYELSCISIPQKPVEEDLDNYSHAVKAGNIFVIGTWRSSVEVISYEPDHSIKALAKGVTETAISGSIPQDVRLVKIHRRLYIVCGLRNGMLLRFEWPPQSEGANDSCPVKLELISNCRIGSREPAFLVPLSDLLDADIIVLSDKPWLLQTTRHSLSLNSLYFQASNTCMFSATPVCSSAYPNGILFVSEDRLHLLEMMQSKILNVHKFDISGTPRKILYHAESRLLLVLRTELGDPTCSSDVCYVDPMSGSVLSSFKLDIPETANCMELLNVGSEQVLVVGTSIPDGTKRFLAFTRVNSRGRLIVLYLEHKQQNSATCYPEGWNLRLASSQNTSLDTWKLRLASSTEMNDSVSAISRYLDCYFLVVALDEFHMFRFENNNPKRTARLATGWTQDKNKILALTTHLTTIAVSDRYGVHLYTYDEDSKKLEIQSHEYLIKRKEDYQKHETVVCHLINIDTALVSYCDESPVVILSSSLVSIDFAAEVFGKGSLKICASFSTCDEILMNMKKGPYSLKLVTSSDTRDSVIASTTLGGIVLFIPLSRDEYMLLKYVQLSMAGDLVTAPILGADHAQFRFSTPDRYSLAEPDIGIILDGEMLSQFLELSDVQKEKILVDSDERLKVVSLLERASVLNSV